MIPMWKKGSKTVTRQIVEIGGDEKTFQFKYILSNLLNSFNLSVENGVSESILILFYNFFENILTKYKILYNELYSRIKLMNKSEKEKYFLKNSIKNSINAFENIYREQIQKFFNIELSNTKFGIEETNSEELFPNTITKSNKSDNYFRVIGGIQSINKKELFLKNNFPIKMVYNKNGNGTNINIDDSKYELIKMFISNPSSYSIGGFVIQSNIYLKSFELLKKYIKQIIKSKIKGINLIDTEFKKMIKGIKLKKISSLSREIQEEYKKIILEKDTTIKKMKLKELSDKFINQYRLGQEALLNIINDIKEEAKILKRQRPNINKEKQNVLKKISHHHKILTNQYFVKKNFNYVFKLLTIKIYDAMRNIFNKNTNHNIEQILPLEYITNLEERYKKIDSDFNSKKHIKTVQNLNKLLNI